MGVNQILKIAMPAPYRVELFIKSHFTIECVTSQEFERFFIFLLSHIYSVATTTKKTAFSTHQYQFISDAIY